MGTFRITYRMEIYIDAETEEEANKIFENKADLDLYNDSEFVEQVSIDEETN